MMSASSRQELLRRSWSQIAEQYEKHLVPRFMPWTDYTLQKFMSHKLPPGPILVPACGPGHELMMLAAQLSDSRQIIGIDIAQGMVDLANERCQAAGISDQASARVGDACDIASSYSGAAGIVSLFGLQQLPEAHLALANWVKALAPGGVVAVTFWPQHVEQKGPWQRLADLSVNKPRAKQPLHAVKVVQWEDQIPGNALAAGGQLMTNEQPSFSMHWSSIREFWEVMTQAGPWHSRRLHMGDEHMERLKQEFMSAYSTSLDCAIEHQPCARLVIIKRNAASL